MSRSDRRSRPPLSPARIERDADAVRYLFAALKLIAIVLGVFFLLVSGLVAVGVWQSTT